MTHMTQLRHATTWLPLAVALLASACSFGPESIFELAPESRLPQWIVIPPGLSRSEVKISMSYYISDRGRTATFTVQDTKGRTVSTISGVVPGLAPYNPNGNPQGDPGYELVTVNGVSEVIEHRRMEPIFYINDDPVIRSALVGPK